MAGMSIKQDFPTTTGYGNNTSTTFTPAQGGNMYNVPGWQSSSGVAQAPGPNMKWQAAGQGGVGGGWVVMTPSEQAQDASLKALTRVANGMGTAPGTSATSTAAAGAGAGAAPSAPPVAPGAVPPPVAPPNDQAAMDAALLRAKEKQGQIATSALSGLHEALGSRQMLGSGVEGMATADVANEAAGNLSDVNVAQLQQSDQNARDLAALSYNGGIAQRGQDVSANTAYRGQDVTARGQDLEAQTARGSLALQQQNAILTALKSLAY